MEQGRKEGVREVSIWKEGTKKRSRARCGTLNLKSSEMEQRRMRLNKGWGGTTRTRRKKEKIK